MSDSERSLLGVLLSLAADAYAESLDRGQRAGTATRPDSHAGCAATRLYR